MEVQFNNVTITVEAETPQEAYAHLCEVFAASMNLVDPPRSLEYTTDTYVFGPVRLDGQKERSTSELWPKEK